MEHHSETDRLRILFQRSTSLPQLNGTAARLVEVIDSDCISAKTLESIISTDPALTTKILRVANSPLGGYETQVATIRAAIMRLGFHAVKSVALSLSVTQMNGLESFTPLFEVNRFSRHSLMVGLLSRYVFARYSRVMEFETAWSADEIMAAGVLHDLAAALLAGKAPEVYERTFNHARRSGRTLSDAFRRIYGISLGDLSGDAGEAWKMPEVFCSTLRYVEEPWASPSEFDAICCIHYADYLAETTGFSITPWEPQAVLAPEILDDMKLTPEELDLVLKHLSEQIEDLLGEVESAAA
jgi:HD-like signal output (HDOD) protein